MLKMFFLSPVLFIIMLIRKAKDKQLHLWGIYGYFGLCGQGKTITMVKRLNDIRKKYGDKVLITTNFGYKNEDFEFTDWILLTRKYDRPLIVAWDEVQNEFNSRKFKDFPISLLTVLTQNRKGSGIQIHYTSQRFDFVDKAFRELTNVCFDCKTYFGNYTVAKGYDFQKFHQIDNVEKKPICTDSISFFHSIKLYESYDTLKMLESAKKQSYVKQWTPYDEKPLNVKILEDKKKK